MKQKTLFNFTYIPEKKLLKQGSESGQPVLPASDNNARKRDKIITEDKGNLQNLLSELDKLVGLAKVKELVREIMAFVEISRRRERFNLKNENLVLHMIFSGNPGTGKTTVARLLGKMLAELKVLPKGHLTEVERADLVGEFIGHTAQKCREQIRKAMGGILFIDEAYSLARGGEKDFGKEAIDTLVKAMEDHKNEIILILAGYQREMEYFLRTNPGLRSRFPIQIHFPDYSSEELLEIAQLMLDERQYSLSVGAAEYLRSYLKSRTTDKIANFSNARLVRNLIEKAIRRQAVRLVNRNIYSRNDLMVLLREDFLPPAGSGEEHYLPD
jgi:stage V sporulation protein K